MTKNYEEWRLDSLGPELGMYFGDELNQIRENVVEEVKRPMNGFVIIPQASDIEEWAEKYTHKMYTTIGVAEWISDYTDDFPLTDVAGSAEVFNVRGFGCAYKYSRDEIAKSRAYNRGIDAKRAKSSRRAIDEKFNRVMFFGDPDTRIWGWVNYPNIPRRWTAFPFDETSSGKDIVRELNAGMYQPWLDSGTAEKPDSVAMASRIYAFIHEEPWTASENGKTDTTIFEQFMKNPLIDESRVYALQELDFAGPNGEHVVIFYPDDEEVFAHKLVLPFTQEAPQQRNQGWITNCHAKTGGIACDRPLAMTIMLVPPGLT